MKSISSFNATELNGKFYLEVYHSRGERDLGGGGGREQGEKDAINIKKSSKNYAVHKLRSPMQRL